MSASKNRELKSSVYEQIARIGKCLSSGPRLEILDLLCQGPRTVEVLAGQVDQSVANTSRHLQVLGRARLVESDKDGVRVRYRLADEKVCAFYLSMRHLAESRLLEIQHLTRDFFYEPGNLEAVDRDLLVDRVRSGEVTVLDVRPTEEYNAGHIPGAISVPIDALKDRLAEIPIDREIVAYCRGPYCVMALEAVEMLRSKGFEAIRFDEGIPDWRARGFSVEISPTDKVTS
tara:strand:+ start:103702 stop:104394 length:693 start_codon:yes stop_codon:yes gene_type:complete